MVLTQIAAGYPLDLDAVIKGFPALAFQILRRSELGEKSSKLSAASVEPERLIHSRRRRPSSPMRLYSCSVGKLISRKIVPSVRLLRPDPVRAPRIRRLHPGLQRRVRECASGCRRERYGNEQLRARPLRDGRRRPTSGRKCTRLENGSWRMPESPPQASRPAFRGDVHRPAALGNG